MQRDAEFRTPEGQAGWLFYLKWMKHNRRGEPTIEAFLTSKFYTAFIKFSNFSRRVRIPDVDTYIWLMTKDSISPNMWTLDEAYARYIENTDRKMSAQSNARITVDTLFDLKEEYGCTDVAAIFDMIEPNVVIQLLRQRRLSPWLLLKSSKFTKFFKSSCSTEERMIMESIIRPHYWAEKFKNQPADVDKMKEYVVALSL
jgi:hypothetical protein